MGGFKLRDRSRDFVLIEYTKTLCSTCMKQIEGKIITKEGKVYISKNCPEHGVHEELLEDNVEFYMRRNNYLKAGTESITQTEYKNGCPHDCGICPEHHQHTCIGLIEVTDGCNMKCPVCYANGADENTKYLSLEKIEEMMDFYQHCEDNDAEILQISGGEPTIHPQILEILRLARSKKFKYVMLNTNGVRISQDEEFVKSLSEFKGDFEVYLQFDGLKTSTYETLRGGSLYDMKIAALKNLEKYKIPTTLVATIHSGVNDDEVASIAKFAMDTPYVRGVNFQPVAYFGRGLEDKANTEGRVTLTGIIDNLKTQSGGMFSPEDFISLPCNVDRIAVSYFFKSKKGYVSITRDAAINSYLPFINNTLYFKVENFIDEIKASVTKSEAFCDCFNFINNFKKAVPKGYLLKSKEEKIRYVDENTFRITIVSFVDKYNFDIKSQQRECVHIITEDLKRIPFSAYNMVYRDKYDKK